MAGNAINLDHTSPASVLTFPGAFGGVACGPDSVCVRLQRGQRVRCHAAKLANDADPAWGWQLTACNSAFVVKCSRPGASRWELLDVWDEVVAAFKAATGGFRCTYSDPDSDIELVPPPAPTD